MNDGKRYEIQTPAESLHWISFNMKSIAKDLKAILQELQKAPSVFKPAPQSPAYHEKHEEIPF